MCITIAGQYLTTQVVFNECQWPASNIQNDIMMRHDNMVNFNNHSLS